MTTSSLPPADQLLAFIDAAPTPFHAVDEAAARLTDAGFAELGLEAGEWPEGGAGFVRRGGALVAWVAPGGTPALPYRLIGAHTDSPNLRIKLRPDLDGWGFRRLAAEPYGSPLLNSWLDRDLGLSGRVAVRESDGSVGLRLFRDDRPLLRVPQLAVHLDREINDKGLLLNRQLHLNPVWGLGPAGDPTFAEWLAERVGVRPDHVLSWDAMCHDTLPAGFLGADEELISAPRLDNLSSCFGAVTALAARESEPAELEAVAVIALFDHEEVGSDTATGASSPLLTTVIERIGRARGATPDETARALAGSAFLSADMAHGTHPNYPERHEPSHPIILGEGPVVKVNVNQRYATDAHTAALFLNACAIAGVPTQTYAHRADMACGSTIGPLIATRLGVPTVDVGMAQLSMHSIRELMATADVSHMVQAFGAWLAG